MFLDETWASTNLPPYRPDLNPVEQIKSQAQDLVATQSCPLLGLPMECRRWVDRCLQPCRMRQLPASRRLSSASVTLLQAEPSPIADAPSLAGLVRALLRAALFAGSTGREVAMPGSLGWVGAGWLLLPGILPVRYPASGGLVRSHADKKKALER